ncbi:saccharopine dehydrogenase NADP-binding domain-containing protein [soil metagenome]
MNSIVVFGSYGYTGQLIVKELKKNHHNVILAGRDEEKLKHQSEQTGYAYEVADIDNSEALTRLLSKAKIVIHCAGPFRDTAKQMVAACLKTKTHYTDITGEFKVFEHLVLYDSAAKKAGIMIMPGVGFDVVPSDCLALHLKNLLPSATHLQLAFTSLKGGASRGTALTAAEGLGQGSFIRSGGKLVHTPAASNVQQINFGSFTASAVSIPWGDISTAYQSTGIPNIEVFMGMPEKMIKMLKWSNNFTWLLKSKIIKELIKNYINKKITGPSDERRQKGRSHLWGKVWDDKGNSFTSLMETFDGYTLTAKTSVMIAEKIMKSELLPGFQTPAMAYGPELILEVENTKRKDL